MLHGVERVHVIACGVLALDLKAVAERCPHLKISLQCLPGGLHNTPRDLRRKLQEAVDDASAKRLGDLIAVGYGVCGLGAVGIRARTIPLALPRVNDCIALFLGSDGAYRQQFAQYPGTYYISAGWVEEKAAPPNSKTPQSCQAQDEEFARLVAVHGAENAQAIRYFLASWQRNYQRAAFIDTGLAGAKQKYADIARAMSEDYGWKYQELHGTHHLLERLILERETTSEILIVPPHYVTTLDAATRKLAAVPVWHDAQESSTRQTIVLNDAASEAAAGECAKMGLGIDAGGTYTDVALYDFATERVVQKAKAPTTKWDYCEGIGQALDKLDPANLAKVDLVCVSTTLATNAIVEGQGQKVGMLILPPYGMFWPEDFDHQPIAPLKGKLEINGQEIEPIDLAQVAAIARDMVDQGVKAFAVSGFASHANPAHEVAVKRIIREQTGMGVTCGHEVSQGLSYKVRADTAMLNARIVPYLQALLEDLQVSLKQRHVEAPIMVVRSDGSLMSVQTASERPIETILSGPAASVAGARYLADAQDAMVVDIGGTTTDTAVIAGGSVRTCSDGASVGGWRTHVRALDMRTMGLGGDSTIAVERRKLAIGPRRVAPVGWLGSRGDPATARAALASALDWLEHHLDSFDDSTAPMSLLTLSGYQASPEVDKHFDDRHRAILSELAKGPLSLHELAARLGYVAPQFLPLSPLEDAHLVQRCALTPTDLLHATGQVQLWDEWAAIRMTELVGRLLGLDRQEFAERALAQFVRLLTVELIKTQLSEEVEADELDRSPVASAMVENLLCGGGSGHHVRFKLKRPIVGIGAPVEFFLPQAARLLETQAIIPPHADVANAVGAITSSIVIQRKVEIIPNEHGRYQIEGLPDAPSFAELDEAQLHAIEQLRLQVLAVARANGTRQRRVEVSVRDRIATITDGSTLFVARMLEAKLVGRPDSTPLPG